MEVLKNISNFEAYFLFYNGMNEQKKNIEADKEIVFSKTIKAGKRIYYVDVKKNRKDEMFLAITESKKVVSGDQDSPSINFEKHKIFLYQEDFENFMNGMQDAINFIREGNSQALKEENESGSIKLDIDF